MSAQYKPDRKGTAALLTSKEMRAAVHAAAEAVAANVADPSPTSGPPLDVVVDDYTTDRAASSVTIRNPQALLYQARDGILTRAAAAAGLEVKGKK